MRLSNSQLNTYQECPRKWKFRYIDKLFSPKIPSPLFFGSALDEAFSYLLLAKKENLTDAELDLQLNSTPEDVFYKKMLVVNHNKQSVELSQSPFADYYGSDFSPELFNNGHVKLLQTLEPSYKLVDFIDFHLQCKEQINARKKLQLDDQVIFNYMSWLSLCEKGKLMITAYKDTIIPQISKVYSLQEPISIKNDDGDSISGFIDMEASFTDAPDVIYTCDNKTSSTPYKPDSVQTSQQLATYSHAKNRTKAAYVVIEKKIFKKAPNIRTSIIKDDVSEETLQKTFDLFEKTVYNISAEKFPENRDSCFSYGRMCEYYQICQHKNYDGLVNLKEEK